MFREAFAIRLVSADLLGERPGVKGGVLDIDVSKDSVWKLSHPTNCWLERVWRIDCSLSSSSSLDCDCEVLGTFISSVPLFFA